MNHDVFICHSSKDRTIANAVCSTLEQNRIRCWIAPRDILPGSDYAESIIEAIGGTKLTVLVFSDNSNHSPHVKREIERTVSHGIPILPFRVEDVIPSPALEYFISDAHWLDAITPPMEQHLKHLVGTVRVLLDRSGVAASSGEASVPDLQPPPASPPLGPAATATTAATAARLPTWWRWGALAAAVIATAVVGIVVLGQDHDGTGAPGAVPTIPGITASASTAPETTSSSTATFPAAPAGQAAALGEAITLKGMDEGTAASVTVLRVVDPTTSTDDYSKPPAGSRFVAVELQIKNTGTVVHEETPDNCVQIVDDKGYRFEAAIVLSVAAGPTFQTSVTLQPGEQATGHTVFEIPETSKVTQVLFALDSGYGDDSGVWAVTSP